MGNIAVGKDHLLDPVLTNDLGDFFFRKNGNTPGIQRPGKLRREGPVFDPWNLGGGEGYHFYGGVIPETDLKIMEIPSRCSHDNNFGSIHNEPRFGFFFESFLWKQAYIFP
jgi:hypothetical protein